jgi:hypothetical protein
VDPLLEQLMWAGITAGLSCALTLTIGYAGFRLWLQPKLEREMKVKLEAEGKALAARIGDKVQDGVRTGVVEGVGKLSSPEGLATAGKGVLETGSGLVGKGVGALLGGGKKRER